jgi:hypothetical protein
MRRVCPRMCPNQRAKTSSTSTIQSVLVAALSVRGDGFERRSPSALCDRVFPCKCLGLVYLLVHGEVAERLKAAVC